MKQTYPINGMDCASCAITITNKVSQLEWIKSCEVNFATHNAVIEFDETKTDITKVSDEIEKYWYELVHKSIDKHNHNEWAHDDHNNSDIQKTWNNVLISTPLVIISIGIMVWMIGIDYAWRPKYEVLYEFFHHLLPIFATIMLFVVWWNYILAIWRYIKYGVASMDTLVGIGTGVAYLYSFLITALEEPFSQFVNTDRNFYESVIVVIGFIAIGKFMEARVMAKTGQAIKALLWLQVKDALIIKNNWEVKVPLHEVQVGDIMIVKPWEKIPLDGIILSWEADIDESMITWEPLPILKKQDDVVIGATIVTNSAIHVKATAVGKDTYLSKIVAIVSQAQNSKPQIQKVVDQIMQWFIPVVLCIAVWSAVFRLVRWNMFFPWINPIEFAIMSFVWVLVIACPCGLWLATPMAIMTWVEHGAKNGILAKNAEGLLKLRKATIAVFDKTWTITMGKPTLVEQLSITGNDEENIRILASLEALSSHPIAHAIVTYAKEKNYENYSIDNFKHLDGVWIQGTINSKVYVVSKLSYVRDKWLPIDEDTITKRTKEGKTPLILSTWNEILWYYAVADTIKDMSVQAIQDLKDLGILPVMITGDHSNTAHFIAQLAGIEKVYAEIQPEQKASIIKDLQKEWIVVMVWDGINDAPALATADIGIAMSTGTDVAIESADLTLLHWDLSKLVKAIKISKLTQSAIWQNLAWAFSYNIIWIPLAGGAFYPFLGVLLNPAFEWTAMAFSDLTVIGNSLRLQMKKI